MITTENKKSFVLFDVLRILIFSTIAVFLNSTINLGVGSAWLIIASIAGVILSRKFLEHNFTSIKITIVHALLFIISSLTIRGANILLLSGTENQAFDFLIPQLTDNLIVVTGFYLVALVSTWFFWTKASTITIEGILSSAALIALLGGHRQYHIDAPAEISSLTWKLPLLQSFQVQPQHLLLFLGALFVLILSVYFYLATDRQLIGSRPQIKHYQPAGKFITFLVPIIFGALLGFFSLTINSHYSVELSRASNGVGVNQNTKEGESNLGFHSATSPTKQPSALLRLEGDYQNNPWAPMMYLREGAVSEFAGHELVKASSKFDTDLPRVSVGEPLILPETAEPNRELVIQSIYLITQHDAPFAIDYPRRIMPIKNPYPERFVQAYQAVSYAPSKPIPEFFGKKLGNSNWTQDIWEHYLRAPGSKSMLAPDENSYTKDEPVPDETSEDLRYLSLARALTARSVDPVEKALQITKFLSEKSLYTRNPGHQVTTGGDPVAPYLFSDEKRGYCVHFSHAAVYMMRLLGIPSRIGTGYLIDKSYAKDGHLLLHLGDRHAWPEVYLDNYGWMVFDVTPQRAENEPAIIPDEKLLEELMNKLDPAQELLVAVPQDSTKNKTILSISAEYVKKLITNILLALFAYLTLLKLCLRYAYILPFKRLKTSYISLASKATDLGYERKLGETRSEYLKRLSNNSSIALALNKIKYCSKPSLNQLTLQEVRALQKDFIPRSSYSKWLATIKYLLAFFSIRSIINFRRL